MKTNVRTTRVKSNGIAKRIGEALFWATRR